MKSHSFLTNFSFFFRRACSWVHWLAWNPKQKWLSRKKDNSTYTNKNSSVFLEHLLETFYVSHTWYLLWLSERFIHYSHTFLSLIFSFSRENSTTWIVKKALGTNTEKKGGYLPKFWISVHLIFFRILSLKWYNFLSQVFKLTECLRGKQYVVHAYKQRLVAQPAVSNR